MDLRNIGRLAVKARIEGKKRVARKSKEREHHDLQSVLS
jgi:hypothetical protein